jgi:hypothetical protein
MMMMMSVLYGQYHKFIINNFYIVTTFNPLRPSGNYMYHQLSQLGTLRFVLMCFV